MARLKLIDNTWKLVDDLSDRDNLQLDGETATNLASGMARRADVLPNADHFCELNYLLGREVRCPG